MPNFTFTVNQRSHTVDVDPEMPLLWVLRDKLQLFGTKYGCGIGVCGACTILEGTRATRACTTTVSAAHGKSFTTIEGLSSDGSHPCQRAWVEEDVAQCGFCQPGMIMEAVALLEETSRPSNEDIDRVFSQHVCRCGTYLRIRKAVNKVASGKAG